MSGFQDFVAWVKTSGTPAAAPGAGGSAAAAPKAAAPAPKPKTGSGRKTTTVDFDDDEGEVIEVGVAKGDPGDTGPQMIKEQLVKLQMYIGDYWDNYRDGIQKFSNKMSFASEEEAEPEILKATFIGVCKGALDIAWSAAADELSWARQKVSSTPGWRRASVRPKLPPKLR